MSKQALKRVRKHLKLEVDRDPMPAFSWPGGYPMLYVCSDGECLCPNCMNKEIEQIDLSIKTNDRSGWRVDAADVNWEDASCYCVCCSQRIESAYAEDDAEV